MAESKAGNGETVARGQGVGNDWPGPPLVGGQGLLVQGDRLVDAAGLVVGVGEIVA